MMHMDVTIESDNWRKLGEDHVHRLAQACLDILTPLAKKKLGSSFSPSCEVSLLFCDDLAIQKLNAEWRGKNVPTNVLSFPAWQGEDVSFFLPLTLGDIVVAYETSAREAEQEGRTLEAHVTHLLVHGFLHLLGYDHETEEEAFEMEALEVQCLAQLHIPNPYAEIPA